jgi:hypothetical protein
MSRLQAFVTSYPWVFVAVLVGALGLLADGLGYPDTSRWGVSAFVLLIAALQGYRMVRIADAGASRP